MCVPVPIILCVSVCRTGHTNEPHPPPRPPLLRKTNQLYSVFLFLLQIFFSPFVIHLIHHSPHTDDTNYPNISFFYSSFLGFNILHLFKRIYIYNQHTTILKLFIDILRTNFINQYLVTNYIFQHNHSKIWLISLYYVSSTLFLSLLSWLVTFAGFIDDRWTVADHPAEQTIIENDDALENNEEPGCTPQAETLTRNDNDDNDA